MAAFVAFFPDANRPVRGLLERIGKPTSQPEDLLNPIVELANLLSTE